MQNIFERDNFLSLEQHSQLESCLQHNWGAVENESSWFASQGLHSSLLPLDRLAPLVELLRRIRALHCEQFACASSLAGLEWWINRNSSHGWHLDKDELLFKRSGVLRAANRSYLYYLQRPALGGELELMPDPLVPPTVQSKPTSLVQPVVGRLVAFDSKTYHRVKPYQGSRLSIAINAWSEPPSQFSCAHSLIL